MQRKTIKEWAEDDRPREKLQTKGPAALSNSELLAILIGTGAKGAKGANGESAIDLAKQILDLADNDLDRLGQCTVGELKRIKGIGPTKAIAIAAAMELGRRRQAGIRPANPAATSSKAVADYLRPFLKDHPNELFGALYIDQRGGIQHSEIISQGGITSTVVDPRVVFRKALAFGAVSLIVYHNHPSGNPTPSKADLDLTQKLQEGAKYLDIRLLDHIIVGNPGHFSFSDAQLLNTSNPLQTGLSPKAARSHKS